MEVVTRAAAARASGLPGLANTRTLPVAAGTDSAEPAGTESCDAVLWGLARFTCKVTGDPLPAPAGWLEAAPPALAALAAASFAGAASAEGTLGSL